MMPSDEYSAVTGGSLKLKGVKGSKVDKQKKKRSKKPKEEGVHAEANKDDGEAVKRNEETATGEDGEDGEQRDLVEDIDEIESSAWSRSTKTEAEIRYEERRRKMVSRLALATVSSRNTDSV